LHRLLREVAHVGHGGAVSGADRRFSNGVMTSCMSVTMTLP
jgi:hypothetical protein